MTVRQLSEQQEADIEEFAADESARVAQHEAKNAERKSKDKESSITVVQEFARQHEWPDVAMAKAWLTKADPTRKLGLAAGVCSNSSD